MNQEQFVALLGQQGIKLNNRQEEQFKQYYHVLVDWNQRMNLTSITDQEGVYLKHFYDSISAAFYYDFDQAKTVMDVGAGAGFPSLPLKICFPHLQITIVDSLQKRITFLQHLAQELGLEQVQFVHARAEDAGQQTEHRQAYDVVMARAVARLVVLTELCLPFAKQGGIFIALKGAKGLEEVKEAEQAIRILGGKLAAVHSFTLPEEEGERNIILIDKVKVTSKKYPRKPGIPNRLPII